jgi:Undecaprenyl-phosphate galactose phosphotransferase WbaP
LRRSPLKQNFRRAWANEGLSKRAVDFFGSTLLIIAFSPVFAAISLMVRRSGKNVIFKQYRVGRNGELFACYKFRTMVPNAEQLLAQVLEENPALKQEWAATQKLRKDPRVTRIGAFLRKTSLDELPQLFNVWKGQMSLVGPRPVVQNEMIRYGRAARWYLCSRPGMTGLWQVSGRNDVDYRRRVALDTYYVQNRNFALDMSILLRTIRVVINKDGCY